MTLESSDPLALKLTDAIRGGNLDQLQILLAQNSELARACVNDGKAKRSLLHIATDWPGHFRNASASVRMLIAAGTDVNARVEGPNTETPLHWAASSDDVEVLEALLDADADLEADGAVVAGGTPLADAVAFAQWNAARRLIARGARSNLWESAARGLLDRVQSFFNTGPGPNSQEVTAAFWCACHGGQRETAEYLLNRGANPNWIGYDNLTPRQAALRSGATALASWLDDQIANSPR